MIIKRDYYLNKLISKKDNGRMNKASIILAHMIFLTTQF